MMLGLSALGWLGGCGGAPVSRAENAVTVVRAEPAPAAVKLAAADETSAKLEVASNASVATTREVPSACVDASACVPPPAFVDAVCKRKFVDLPLFLFAGKMPWQHLYVKAEYVEPVNPHGGEQSEAWMQFGEEVVVLRRRAPGGGSGVQISGPSDLDVLRWDGTCATIRAEMFVSYVPAPMQSPRIIWKYLDGELQAALLKNAVVALARGREEELPRLLAHSPHAAVRESHASTHGRHRARGPPKRGAATRGVPARLGKISVRSVYDRGQRH